MNTPAAPAPADFSIHLPTSRKAGVVRALAGPDALLVLSLSLVALLRLALAPMAFQADTWLALVDGRAISSSGIPHQALFTIMVHGRAFTDQQWLAQLASYGLQQLGGLPLLAGVFVVFQSVSIAFAAIAARRLGAEPRSVILVLALGWWLTLMPAQIRPQAFVLPLFVALMYHLALDSRRPSRRVYWSLALLLVWANLHGSAVLAAALIGLRALSLVWERRRALGNAREWVRPAALIIGCGVCLIATPYGLHTIGYYHQTLFNSSLARWITEWQPITKLPFLAVPFFILVAVMIWTFGKYRHATTVWERSAIVLLGLAAADAQRNAVWFGLAAVMLAPVGLSQAAWTRNRHRPKTAINLTIAAISILAVAIFGVQKIDAVNHDVQTRYPSQAIAVIGEVLAAHPALTIYADGNIADWLIWHQPSLGKRLAYNDQLELLATAQFNRIERLIAVAGTHWKQAAIGYRLLVLNDRESPDGVRAFEREPGATVLYHARGYSVILRSSPASTRQ